MKFFAKNSVLLVIAVIAIVNALGYGIIIPILYSYSHKFGLNDFQNGLLFSVFSIFQFISTPIIGRLSDKYGRKPLLLISLAGTCVSFLTMAFAPSALFLFIARAIDGITAGNIPVALAVISDTTDAKDRAKGFGIIGASFGFGFVFGPSISALTVGFGPAVPFLVAAGIAAVAVILTLVGLAETNKHKGLSHHEKLFDFVHMAKALVDPNVGTTLILSLLYSFGFSLFIYAYQPLSVEILHLTPTQISINFTLFGLVGLIAQALIIPKMTKRFGEREMLRNALLVATVTFIGFFLTRSLPMLIIVSLVHALANGFVNPLVQALLSKEVDEHSQGSIQGLNASYVSIGMIVGPIVGGVLATKYIPLPFLIGSGVVAVCFVLSLAMLRKFRNPVAV